METMGLGFQGPLGCCRGSSAARGGLGAALSRPTRAVEATEARERIWALRGLLLP